MRFLKTSLAVSALTVMASAHALNLGLKPNSQRYKDTGAKPHVGLFGKAQVQTRALLGKDRLTTVEVTTGDFVNGPVAGSRIKKVDFKMGNKLQKLLFSENYNNLNNNGYFSVTTNKLSRFQKFEIQSTVDMDTKIFNTVVKTDTTVYMRPDINVESVGSADKIREGQLVSIIGTISEINGDVSAAGDCVLRVGGVEVSRLTNIWVDKADRAYCFFRHTISRAGTYEISVAVESVNPGDYDLANNVKKKTIQVISNNTIIANGADFMKATRNLHYEQTYDNFPDSTGVYDSTGPIEQLSYSGQAPDGDFHPGGAFTVSENSGKHSLAWSGVLSTEDVCPDADWNCYMTVDLNTGRVLDVATNSRTLKTSIFYNRFAQTVTYWGGTGAFAKVNGYSYTQGQVSKDWGTSFSFQVQIDNNGTPLAANDNFVLAPYNDVVNQPLTCTNDVQYWGKYCVKYSMTTSGIRTK